MGDWVPISEAQTTTLGTVADLKMPSGRVYRAVWRYIGNCCAWWPESNQRQRPIGLYDPAEFRVVAVGIVQRKRAA
jgi:hypothetical protein